MTRGTRRRVPALAVVLAGLLAGLLLHSTATARPATAAAGTAVDTAPWYFEPMGIPAAHEQATGKGVTIALIDTQVDVSVPDLQGADVQPAGSYCRSLWDPDTGWHPGAGPPDDPSQALASTPGAEHATSLSALLVGTGRGTGPAGAGVRGVAPDATVRVYATSNHDSEYACGGDRLAGGGAAKAAIVQAVDDGADIISMSLQTSGASPRPGLQYAVDHGVPVVISAGNSGDHVTNPSVPGVVTVGAADQAGERWERSSYGPRLTLLAPGVQLPVGGYAADGSWDSTITASGTSAAAPVVAGLMALVMQKYPDATGNQIVQQLVRSTTRDGETRHEPQTGFGIPKVSLLLGDDPGRWPDLNPLTLVEHDSELANVQTDAEALAAGAAPATATTSSGATAGTDRASDGETTAGRADASSTGGAGWPWIAGGGLVLVGVAVVLAGRWRRSAGDRGPVGVADRRQPAHPGVESKGH